MLRRRLHQQVLLMTILVPVSGLLLLFGTASAAQLRLSWSDNSNNEEGFEIQRNASDTTFTTIAIVGTNVSSFTDTSLAPGTDYCYRVRAFNANDLSDFSNIGCAATPTTVSVSTFGSGMGTVLSSPAGIECGNDCIEPYARGTVVTLTPTAAEGSMFVGWSGGGCGGTGMCIFNVETDLSITAQFDSLNPESSPPPSDPPPPPTNPSPLPLVLTGLNADLASPQFIGSVITFTAAASGGIAPLEFKWWVFDGSDWRVGQEWNTSNTFVFAPANPASYVIGLWVRSSGSINDGPENDAVLTRTFTIMPLSCPTGRFLAEFYNNMSLSGSPAFTACDSTVNYDWATAGPGNGIGSDNFSVRWTGRFPSSSGIHTFTATADDGIRVWIDGNLIIDAWVDQGPTTYQATLDLSEGEHLVQVEYYENGGGALAQFNWQRMPTSNPDYFVMLENQQLVVDAPGVLGNDNDLNNNMLTATLLSPTTNGVVELNPNGSFTYTPNDHFSGADNFVYIASTGSATGNPTTVTITVTAVNDQPLASNDSFVIIANDHWTVDAPGVLGNDNDLDGDVLSAVLVDSTTNGTLILNPDGSFIYTPNLGFTGTDTFTYRANDGQTDSNIAMVTITVTEINETAVAQNDAYETLAGSLLSVAAPGVLVNDTDANNDSLAVTLVTPPLFGTVTLNADGSFDYIPAMNFTGTDSFSYKANDGSADSNVAMVTITVNAPSGM